MRGAVGRILPLSLALLVAPGAARATVAFSAAEPLTTAPEVAAEAPADDDDSGEPVDPVAACDGCDGAAGGASRSAWSGLLFVLLLLVGRRRAIR